MKKRYTAEFITAESAEDWKRGRKVVIGGPHATLLPEEVMEHADAVVVGEGELVWPKLLQDFENGELKRLYRSCELPDLQNMPHPRWDLIKGRVYGKGVTIASRRCPFACDYCSIPAMYQRKMRYRPIESIVEELRHMPGRALIFWDDNIGANRAYAKELFKAIAPFNRCFASWMQKGAFLRETGQNITEKTRCLSTSSHVTRRAVDGNRMGGSSILFDPSHPGAHVEIQDGIVVEYHQKSGVPPGVAEFWQYRLRSRP